VQPGFNADTCFPYPIINRADDDFEDMICIYDI